MFRLFLFGACALLLAGCRCDLEDNAHYLAGSRATECGYVELDGDRTAVFECFDRAIATEWQAYGGWQEPGTDSEIRRYYVVRPDRVYDLLYDSDPSGGDRSGARITVSPCIGTPVRTDTGYWCEGEALDPYTLCD